MPATPDYQHSGAQHRDADDCPVCGRTATVIAPICTEGHGSECPDRLCVECGTAMFIDPMVSQRRRASRIA